MSITVYKKIQKERKGQEKDAYLQNERRHEIGLAKLIIAHLIYEMLDVGNATPPQLVLSISHGKCDKNEL